MNNEASRPAANRPEDEAPGTLATFVIVSLTSLGFGLMACLPFYVMHRLASALGL